MSDQALQQSPQSRLEAMLGDIQDDATMQNQEEPQEEIVEDTTEDLEEEEEVVEDTNSDEEPEADDEVEEEDSEEEQPVKAIKLKVNGEEIEKPLDEVVALAQQGLDYTKKTQEVAEQRKAVETMQEQLKAQEQQFMEQQQLNSLLIEDVAKITSLDQQLSQYANVDWQKLTDSDFVEAQKHYMTYNQLQQERNNLVSQFEAKRQEALTKHQSALAERIKKGKEVLAKEIPNWSPETTQEVVTTGKEYGFTDDELNAIVDPRHVKVLYDAMQWRKLKSKNPVVKKKVASAKPVVKPGTKDPKTSVNSNAKKIREQLRRSGSSELASKLIEQMI